MLRSCIVPILLCGFTLAPARGENIDTQRSSITIHVGKSGLFAAAGHAHWIDAPIASGMVDSSGPRPNVRFTVDAGKLSVRTEKGVSSSDQAEVQSNMQAKVLESARYPEILFRSTQVRSTGESAWKVSGDLTLHGVTKPVILDVARENGAYVGSVSIKQTSFSIQPIKIAGGVVKVKDELEITVQVFVAAH